MAKPGNRRRSRVAAYETAANRVTHRMAGIADDLSEFEEFKRTTLKAIRKDIKNGMSAAKIREKYLAILQGRLITDALTTDNTGLAQAIVKDVADRVEGRATEKKEVTHRFKDMSEKELDAVLKSEEQELEDMQKRFGSEQ